ncbi:Hypothetical predicted protein [Marmota monax]|uniref:Uncharacterized protein n=1 Tax=Marmota monax TaxID=9995 RepID=A0A5E4BS51_MARMO|nr:Hypothetical predicted protein [Marmota monax]
MLWKQLEVLKDHWGQLKLGDQDISSASFHKQYSELYEADILYPSMKAIARQMGKEDEFERLIINSQSILPPKGASEIEIKTQQLQKLLENIEIHMIQEVLRKVNKEMTLVLSEKSKKESTLPTDLWKHQVMKENFSVARPQIVEKFIQKLMENYQDSGPEITFRKDHLEACLLSLGCDVMARERSNFETYSMCYEHVLQHTRQKLCQKEQELEVLQRSQVPPEDHADQVAELSHDMIMEITALRAQLTDLEEENINLKKQIKEEVQEEYEALVQALFMTCLHRKEKLNENWLNLTQKVCELISEVRTEGITNMKELRKKWGSARPDEGIKENVAKVAELSHDMIMEITALRAQLTDLEEENINLKKQIKEEVQEEYEALVQALFMTCLHRKEKLNENWLNLTQKVCELISEVRTEGITNMKELRKKWGSARPDEGIKENVAKEQLLALEQDNRSLAALVCKVRSLGLWRQAVQQTHFRGQLSRAEKESIRSKKECLRIKLMAEQEAGLFRQQLLALRQALASAQADNAKMRKRQDDQVSELQTLLLPLLERSLQS